MKKVLVDIALILVMSLLAWVVMMGCMGCQTLPTYEDPLTVTQIPVETPAGTLGIRVEFWGEIPILDWTLEKLGNGGGWVLKQLFGACESCKDHDMPPGMKCAKCGKVGQE